MARPAHLATPLLEVARGLLRRTPTPLRAYLTLTARLGYLPRYRNPRTFNEKLVWLLRNTDDPRRAQLADKLALKAYVARVTPEAKTARVITAAPRGEALDLTNLPERCVLKVNNGYQRNLVLRAPHDSGAIVARANAWLAEDPAAGLFPWETHYRAIPPMVFIEAFLGDPHAPSLTDHKVFVFGGRAHHIRVMSTQEPGSAQRIAMDPDWNVLPAVRNPLPWEPSSWQSAAEPPPRPKNLAALLSISERLAGDLPFVRVDSYLLGDDIYIGELTFSPAGGAIPFPYPFDLQLGEQWALPMRGGR